MKILIYILVLSLPLFISACKSNTYTFKRSPELPITPSTPALTSLIMLGGPETLALNTTTQLYAATRYQNGTISVVTPKVSWKSSDPSVATISSTGLVVGLKQGKTTISASYYDRTSNTQDLVVSPVKSITIINGDHGTLISAKDYVLGVKKNKKVRIMAILSNKTTADLTHQVKWSSDNNEIATVDQNGLISGVSAGETTINATTIDNLTAHLKLNITNDYVNDLTIYGPKETKLKSNNKYLCIGISQALETVDMKKTVHWTSSNTSVADIDQNGIVQWHKPGKIDIKCISDYDNVNIYKTIEFNNKKLVSIELHEGNNINTYGLPVGPLLNKTTQTIPIVHSVHYPFDVNKLGLSKNGFYVSAWGTYSDGSVENISKLMSWWSSDQQDVYLNYLKGPYLFGRNEAQNVLITASFEGLSASFHVNVEDAPVNKLVSIDLYKPDGTILDEHIGFKGLRLSNLRIHAIGTYDNGLRKDISSYILYTPINKVSAAGIIINDLQPNVLYFGTHPLSDEYRTKMTASWQGITKEFTITSLPTGQ
ncbi:MAG: Ig-like domain-containing protein [Psychromonas sp.]|nr:Ig-like domain-containing protein [Psychromonas sp.]